MHSEEDILLICAGSGAGRVPFTVVGRDDGAEAVLDGCWLTVASRVKEGPVWSLRILSRDTLSALQLADALKKKEVYSLCPDDFGVRTIVFYRDDWGALPRWIGGDIAGAKVDASLYRFGGNKVYGLKEEPNQAPEPTAPSGRGSS